MGFASAKTYDLEVWLSQPADVPRDSSAATPRRSSAAREHQVPPESGGKTEFVHRSNGLASPSAAR